ncbi:MBL fold metallo-hydrolase, partial [Salmonella enterica subsp. enterica serovar Anatum]
FGAASPVGFVNRPFEGSEPYTLDDLPDIDLLVITHDHWDHLDYNTVRALKNRVQTVVCPLGVGEHLEYWGYNPKKIMELDWYEQRETPEGIRIACAPTRHFSGRGLRRNQTLWGAFVLETSTGRIYIGGDGGYGKHLKET